MRIQGCDEHQGIFHIVGYLLSVNLNPDDAMPGEGARRIGDESDGVKEVMNDDRLENIQFKISL